MKFLTLSSAFLSGANRELSVVAQEGDRIIVQATEATTTPTNTRAQEGDRLIITAEELSKALSVSGQEGDRIIADLAEYSTLVMRGQEGDRILATLQQYAETATNTRGQEGDRAIVAASTPTPSPSYTLPTSQTLTFWQSAQNGVTGDPLSEWLDQSGNGYDTTYTPNNPTVSANSYNGHQAIYYDGGIITVSYPAIPSSNVWTIINVCTSLNDSVWFYAAANRQARIRQSNAQTMSFYNGANPISSALPVNTSNLAIYVWLYDGPGGNLKMYQNGVNVYDGSVPNVAIAWDRIDSSPFTRPYGDLVDRFLWSGIVTNGELNTLGGEIATKYGLSWTNIS